MYLTGGGLEKFSCDSELLSHIYKVSEKGNKFTLLGSGFVVKEIIFLSGRNFACRLGLLGAFLCCALSPFTR